ncbi:protein PHOTOPERIOD-INDEPENDENT EARLY FLOWERING 1-like isoform X1 [Musa acuminata AAA Group]|uniref:protein PHOTOPERIOD-INDEPENDENT EARLY FLOWERING 1-like isoform X1 n=2 Tax=Musa acuminata AAA Group TaxID=214697 RepID=UPI0031DCEAFC
MASKGPRSKLDHETRARRQKALEVPKEPPRPKTHWDHVIEEMVWLSKDFESERKWKLAQAKKVAIRASKSVLDYATRGEKKVKEEEQRLKKVALNISKDVKKFWIKIEKLVLYKFQLDVEERKKKALDKQLDFLLGQTERYSTMLAENLVDVHYSSRTEDMGLKMEQDAHVECKSTDAPATQLDNLESGDDFSIRSEDDLEDDECTIEEDEAQITEEERREELTALKAEADLPLEELLKFYAKDNSSRKDGSGSDEDLFMPVMQKDQITEYLNQVNGENVKHHSAENNHVQQDFGQPHNRESNGDSSSFRGQLTIKKLQPKLCSENLDLCDMKHSTLGPSDDLDDRDYTAASEEKDDETTLSEEEELAKKEEVNPLEEIKSLKEESEMPVEELLARYNKDLCIDDGMKKSDFSSSSTDDQLENKTQNLKMIDGEYQEDKSPYQNELDSSVYKEIKTDCDNIMDGRESEIIIADAAAAARSAQPTGNTFSTTKVRTKFPFLLKHPLREYQHIGLDWLVTMYEKRLNGILADEMGLGKTIMTIALLAHLACDKGIWGPHLIVVPTSVMLNWETEFLKWCPAFKILTYFGSAKERKLKRQGWLKPNYFHICITTYRLVIQDSKVFKRKKWKYLILDEAHLIKNWKSQRWQTLLNFNSKRRILLTGTPLQNDLMELWSLMHFLMPHIFQSHQEFKDWFCNPISGMVEGQEKVNKEVVDRLHNVLRPFILRRLKRDVEKQLPKKHEHVIYCRLSRRQRNLYEDFIASSETQATLASSNFFGMISVIMQLRKVCNHPDLFEGRPIVSSFDMAGMDMQLSSSICTIFSSSPFSKVDLCGLNFVFTQNDYCMTSWVKDEVNSIACPPNLIQRTWLEASGSLSFFQSRYELKRKIHGTNIFEEIQKALWEERVKHVKERAMSVAWWNSLQCQKKPVYGTDLRKLVTIKHPVFDILEQKNNPSCYMNFSSRLADIVLSPIERFQKILDLVECFMFAIPASRAPFPVCWCSKGRSPVFLQPAYKEKCREVFAPLLSAIRPAIVRRQVYFPDRRLIQFDCGKLQELAILLRRLKAEGHRALIFTQMTKMLDILEAFINLYGFTYMRLDGSTQPEERQTLMQRFNTNPKYFLFILSTRSGGVGINLVGADTVIFYDSDWNPAMDQQAQDRCHRIGQTREVHIYRLISESTIEENILKKANQKRALDDLVIQSGSYNMEFFKKLDPMELFSGHRSLRIESLQKGNSSTADCSANGMDALLSNADVEAAIKQAEDEADYMALKKLEQEEAVDNQEFTEDIIGRSEDDEPVNEDETKLDEKVAEEQNCCTSVSKENDVILCSSNMCEQKSLALGGEDEDMDMLADVKQMAAAAAAAGQASSSFENQLRPIDRYAMRFLELWDPIVDKSAIEYQAIVEEQEWELDRIEKFKDELEAEIDEDQEPFLYERWDADFATTAYRQHVEALAQQQLLEELECEAQLADDADDENDAFKNGTLDERKPKTKKKMKKTKFKSLKKGPLASDMEVVHEEPSLDDISVDDKVLSPDIISAGSPTRSPPRKKRKKVFAPSEDEENNLRKSIKKLKKASHSNHVVDFNKYGKHTMEATELKLGDGATESDLRPASRTKSGGKISIAYVPVKRVIMVKPERFRKRGPVWSKDCFPAPDIWSSQEDALLCAIVHEYGTNWSFISDTLNDIPCGGSYRGRFRHPVHCCERFRELFFKYVLSAMDSSNTEKITSSGSGKALLKVTEDQIRVLLNVTSELPDNELLLQKHFLAILSSVWRANCLLESYRSRTSSKINFCSNRRFSDSCGKSQRLTGKMNLASSRQSSKLVSTALTDVYKNHEDSAIVSNELGSQSVVDHVNLMLDFPSDEVNYDSVFPSTISLSIHVPELPQAANEPPGQFLLAESSCGIAENRFRLASEACFEGDSCGWASSAFPSSDTNRYRCGLKSQSLGKHKSGSDIIKPSKLKIQRTTEVQEDPSLVSKYVAQPRPTTLMESFDILDTGCDHSQWHAMDALEEPQFVDIVPHAYDPNFFSGLEEMEPLQDITDVG